jgi:REP element-mobilizing transposase RayT
MMRMKINPDLRKRRSICLTGYDYSQAGLYFVTVCVRNKECLFGTIENGQMILNEVGKIANDCWLAIPDHFPHAVLHEHIVMPNHVHGIVELTGDDVGANHHSPLMGSDRAKDHPGLGETGAKDFSLLQAAEFRSPSQTIGSIVRGFKIDVTKGCRQHTNVHHIWQRNYYEHIIRTPASHEKIADYIIHNPAKWQEDSLYQD